MREGLSILPRNVNAWARALYNGFLLFNLAVLAAQTWSFFQTAYIRQEALDFMCFFAMVPGLGLLITSILALRENMHKSIPVLGLATSLANLSIAAWWMFADHGAIIN